MCSPDAWYALTPAEKAEVLALFPDTKHVLNPGTPEACPNVASLLNDDNFRHDCARYVEDLQSGLHDLEWMEQAWEAHEMRRAGVFDEYLAQNFEATWEVELPEALKPAAIRAAAAAAARGDIPAQEGGEAKVDDHGDELSQEIQAPGDGASDNDTNGRNDVAEKAMTHNENKNKTAPARTETTNGNGGTEAGIEKSSDKPSGEMTESPEQAESPVSKVSMDISEGKNSTDNEVAKGLDEMAVH